MLHGGDIYRNNVELDFSVNINPLGMPKGVKAALMNAIDVCMDYPDYRTEELKEEVARMLSVKEEYLTFTNGASEGFMAIVYALQPKHVVIPIPSFYGYQHAAAVSEGVITYYPMKQEADYVLDKAILSVLDENVDMLFLANPNNPVGNLIPQKLLMRIVQHCMERNIYVVLDECFIELCEGAQSLISYIEEYQNLIIVRAFTKSFAIPGVRLGYLVCSDDKIRTQIEKHLPEWNVSLLAQKAGIACTEETDFLRDSVRCIHKERTFMAAELFHMGIEVFPSDTNFLLLYSDMPLYERLLEQGILIRDCSNYEGLSKGYYRIAIKQRPENEKLIKAIGEIL